MPSDAEKDALLAAMANAFEGQPSVKLVATTSYERFALRVRMREVSSVIGARMLATGQRSDVEALQAARLVLDRWVEDDAAAERTRRGVVPV